MVIIRLSNRYSNGYCSQKCSQKNETGEIEGKKEEGCDFLISNHEIPLTFKTLLFNLKN